MNTQHTSADLIPFFLLHMESTCINDGPTVCRQANVHGLAGWPEVFLTKAFTFLPEYTSSYFLSLS